MIKAVRAGVGFTLGFFLYVGITFGPIFGVIFLPDSEPPTWVFGLALAWMIFFMIACPAAIASYIEEKRSQNNMTNENEIV